MVEPTPILVDLDRDAPEPLHLQLYRGLREAILSGRLKPGRRIPATRTMAEELAISRTTVLTAVRRLMVEGFLEARVGAGTWVSESIREELLGARDAEPPPDIEKSPGSRLASRGRALASLRGATPAPEDAPRPFQVGIPALDAFPWEDWARLVRKRLRLADHGALAYGPNEGFGPLRRAIAEHVGISRGVACEPDQVLVVSGSQAGLTLLCQTCLDPEDGAWVEDPGYPGVRGALAAAGARAVPVPVDERGLQVPTGERAAPEARLAYVTPSHQFPLGVTMSLPRRLALLDWARRAGAWVVEDDYDAEYRYAGKPLMSLQGLDGGRRVIYLGTFSKTLFPALRLGFLVLPPDIVGAVAAARSFFDQHPPTLLQAALADFLDEGRFARHVRRMRDIYAARRDALLSALQGELGGLLRPFSSHTGLHCAVRFTEPLEDGAVADEAREEGLDVLPLSAYSRGDASGDGSHGLVLGFGSTPEAMIRQAVPKLAAAVERVRARRGVA